MAELTPDGPRIMLVDPGSGAEQPGPPAGPAEQEWLRRWWPLHHPGERAELGRPRCAAWAAVVGRLAGGLALAADYAHSRDGRPLAGTLAGFRAGRAVRPIPDGSRDITAHVALDACAAAGAAAGATQTVLTTQRAALRALGLTGRRPPLSLADREPARVPGRAAAGRRGGGADRSGRARAGSAGWSRRWVSRCPSRSRAWRASGSDTMERMPPHGLPQHGLPGHGPSLRGADAVTSSWAAGPAAGTPPAATC